MKYTILPVALLFIFSACGKAPVTEMSSKWNDENTEDDRGETVKLSRQAFSTASQAKGFLKEENVRGGFSPSSNPYYGYGYTSAVNSFLGYTDQLHYQNPDFTSFAKIRIGQNIFDGYYQGEYCAKWNLTLNSNRTIRVFAGNASSASGTQIQWNWTSTNANRTGLVIGIQGQYNQSACYYNSNNQPVIAAFDPFAVAIASQNYSWNYGQDPYSYGWNGNFNGNYYYYPPPLCGAQQVYSTLQVSGTVSDCNGGNVVSVNLDLTNEVNANNGYAPFKEGYIMALKHDIRARVVNYNGSDWAGTTYSQPLSNVSLTGKLQYISGEYYLSVAGGFYRLTFSSNVTMSTVANSVNYNVRVSAQNVGGNVLQVQTFYPPM